MHSGNWSRIVFPNMWLLALILLQTGIAQSSGCLDTRACFHLMQNMELKTLNHFLRFPAHDLRYLSPFSPLPRPRPSQKKPTNCQNSQNTNKQIKLNSWDNFADQIKSCLMFIMEIRDFEIIFMCPNSWFQVSEPSFPKFP